MRTSGSGGYLRDGGAINGALALAGSLGECIRDLIPRVPNMRPGMSDTDAFRLTNGLEDVRGCTAIDGQSIIRNAGLPAR